MSCIGILLIVVGLGGVGTKHNRDAWCLVILGSLLITAEQVIDTVAR